MGNDSFDLYMPESSRGQHAAGKPDDFREFRLAIQFIDCGPAHHALDRDLSTQWWNLDGVTRLEPQARLANSVQQQIVKINRLQQLRSAEVADQPQGTARGGAARNVECVERRRQCTHIVSTGAHDISYDVDPDCAQPGQRYVGLGVAILSSERI